MKNLKFLLITFWLFSAGTAIMAQEVICVTGGNSASEAGKLSYTVGQVACKSYTSSMGTITQGVQQPYEIFVVGIDDLQEISLSCSAYPNPVKDFVFLKLSDEIGRNHTYQLYNINGILLKEDKIQSNQISISLENLASSIYFLKVLNHNQNIKTFKIIKH